LYRYTHKEGAITTQRLNLAIESELYHSLKQIAAHKNISVTKLINDRLNQSLTLEERLGKKPEWLLKMEEAGFRQKSHKILVGSRLQPQK